MKHALKLLAISAIALLISSPAALAQSPEVSTLTVSEPTEVSGTILQPGTYLVRVVSPQADRNKVQITSLDRETIYATVLTVPHQLEPNEEIPNTTFVFFPAGEGKPRALRTWFSTNPVTGGHDFVYDEGRAKQLARLAKEPVIAYRSEETVAEYNVVTPEATVEPYVFSEPEPAPVATTVETTRVDTTTEITTPAPVTAPIAVETTTETTTELTTPEPAPTPMASSAPEDTAPEMPQTASRIPLLALLGVVSLAAAVVIRFARA